MINVHLYNVLRTHFDFEIIVKHENVVPVIINKKEGANSSFLGRASGSNRVSLSSWGETFQFSCPYCNDTRHRFFMSGFSGSSLTVGDDIVHVRDMVCSCKNENCHNTREVQEEMIKLVKNASINKLLRPNEECIDPFVKQHIGDVKGMSCLAVSNRNIALPTNLLPLDSNMVPDYVRSYITGRGFSISSLSNNFEVKVCTPGSKITNTNGVSYDFGYYAILIPLISRRLCLGWQARLVPYVGGRLLDPKEERAYLKKCSKDKSKRFVKKYRFASGIEKNKGFYNMDKALFHKHIVLCEGVTDVWKVGGCAIASYGKTLSQAQIEVMRIMWGWGLTSLIVAYDSEVDCSALIKQLRALRIFSLGVARLNLPDGMDPGDMSKRELNSLIKEARLNLN